MFFISNNRLRHVFFLFYNSSQKPSILFLKRGLFSWSIVFLFSCDYLEGAHPAILQRLCETNFAQTAGYGTDEYCESAREKIRAACGAPNAEIHFLVGGTQTNATVIDALLRSYEGVIAADTGHISVHEAGAIEFGGHKGAHAAAGERQDHRIPNLRTA